MIAFSTSCFSRSSSRGRRAQDYTAFLNRGALRRARIGVLHQAYDRPTADPEILRLFDAALDDMRRQGKAIRLLSSTITSPTTRKAIAGFLAGFPNARHVVWDSLSGSAIGEAHFRTHGVRAWPQYRLEQADVLVSFDADFLGTWIAPVPLPPPTKRAAICRALCQTFPTTFNSKAGCL